MPVAACLVHKHLPTFPTFLQLTLLTSPCLLPKTLHPPAVLGRHHASSTSCLKQLAAELRHVQGSQQQRLSVLQEVHSRCVEGPAGGAWWGHSRLGVLQL